MIISTKISFIPSRCTRTKQQDPDSPIHSFPIALEDLFYLDIPLLGIFFRRISGFGTHATHGELSNGSVEPEDYVSNWYFENQDAYILNLNRRRCESGELDGNQLTDKTLTDSSFTPEL